jgi:multicomponent Na+:H+ antiporter subunit G
LSALLDAATLVLLIVGLFFYTAGAVGLLRFPDPHSRLHALTKADNLGLGFVAAGLILQAADVFTIARIALAWLLTLLAAATVAQLVARAALREESESPRVGAQRGAQE